MITSLNEKALQRAREKIREQFSDPSAMEEIGSIRVAVEKKLAAAESQLNGSVQSKLDGLKRVVDLMDESTTKLDEFTHQMSRIDNKILQTNTSISKYDDLKRVNNAKENIQKRIPQRVGELRTILETDSTKLKEVYLDTLRLESYGAALLREIQRRNTKATSSSEMVSEDVLFTVRAHLSVVMALSEEILSRLRANIDRMWDLATARPADLVGTFEVIEMHQQLQDRRKVQLAHRVMRGVESVELSAEEAGPLHSDAEIRIQAVAAVKKNMEDKLEASFTVFLEEGLSHGSNRVSATLGAATQVLAMMTVFKNEVAPCIPPSYGAVSLFLDAFDAQLRPHIAELAQGTAGKLEVSDMMQLIDWLEYFVHQANVFDNIHSSSSSSSDQMEFLISATSTSYATSEELKSRTQRISCKEYIQYQEALVLEYLDRIKNQVMEWFNNIKKQNREIIKASDGTLITTTPEDMFNVIHMQLAVAQEKLPKEHIKDVVNACLQVLREVQRSAYDDLDKVLEATRKCLSTAYLTLLTIILQDWERVDPEALCSVVNDMQRLQEKAEEFSNEVVAKVVQDADRERLLEMTDDVSSEYLSIAVKAISYLSKCVLLDLEEPVFTRLFTHDWETGVGEALGAVIAVTLQVIGCYVKAISIDRKSLLALSGISNNASSGGNIVFQNKSLASDKIMQDAEHIAQFFRQYQTELVRGGLRNITNTGISGLGGSGFGVGVGSSNPDTNNDFESALGAEMAPLAQLARIINSSQVSHVESDITSLLAKYGADGLKVVVAAIGSNSSLDREKREESLMLANRLYNKGAAGYGTSSPATEDSSFMYKSKKNTAGGGLTYGGFFRKRAK